MPVCRIIHLLMGVTAVLSLVTLLCFGMYLPDLGIFNDINPDLVRSVTPAGPWCGRQYKPGLHSTGTWGAELGVQGHFALLTPGFQAAWCSWALHRTSTGSEAGLQLLLCSLVW